MKTKKKILSLILLCFVCVSAFMISFINNKTNTYTKQNTIEQDNSDEIEIADLSPHTYTQTRYNNIKNETLYGGETVKYRDYSWYLTCEIISGAATATKTGNYTCNVTVKDATSNGTVKVKLTEKDGKGNVKGSKTIKLTVLKNIIYKETIEKSITLNFKNDWDSKIDGISNFWPNSVESKDCSSYNATGSTGDSSRKFNLVRKDSCIGKTTYVTIDARRWGVSHKLQYRIKILSTSRNAPSTGCYSCEYDGDTIIEYYKKGAAIPAYHNCTKDPVSTYEYDSSTKKCKKKTTPTQPPTQPPTPTVNTKPVEQPPTTEQPTPYDNKDFYIKNGGTVVTGSLTFACGDKVHVSTCTTNGSSTTCNVTSINGTELGSTTTVESVNLVNSFNEANCSLPIKRYIRSATPDAKYYSNSTLSEGETKVACGATIEFYEAIVDACNYKQNDKSVCKAKYDGKEIFIPREYLTTNEQTTCSNNQKTTESDTCEAINKLTDQAGNNIKVKECYKKVNGELVYQYEGEQSDLLKCKEGYNKILVPTSDNGCENVSEGKVCYKTLTYNCSKVSKPRVEASGSIINAQGMGTINIKGISESGRKLVGYYISTDKTASISSDWKQFTEQSTDNSARIIATATETKGSNTYFVWVKDDNNALSRAVMVKIYDADLTTTLKDIEIKSSDGSKTYKPTSIKDDTEIAYNNTMKKDAKYVRLSNSLTENTDIAGFEPLSTAYELTVDSPSIALYATLTSDDASYVEGYEPRTVNLEYGENTVLIKIRNNQGKERTYTFIVTREDNRENNNLLSDVTLSAGKIEFDSYNSDYTITVPKNLKSVSINGTLSSTKASFVEGYAPRTVKLENEVTSAVIKTISESGSVRSYVFTFEKRGAKEDVTTKNSVYLSSLSIPGTELKFSKETTSYQVSVEHEVDLLRVYALPESENATVEISNTNGLKVGPNLVQITVKNNSKKKIYTIYVNRKEEGLNISGNTNLGSLTIKDYKIDFNKDILDYTLKIKREKTLMIAATAESKKSEVYMYGNNDLTGFSTVRVKVIAENGDTKVYSIDIQKDSYNKVLELTAGIVGGVIIIGAAIIIVISKKKKKMKEYMEG